MSQPNQSHWAPEAPKRLTLSVTDTGIDPGWYPQLMRDSLPRRAPTHLSGRWVKVVGETTIFPRTPPWTALPKVPYNMGKLEDVAGGANLTIKLIKPSVPEHWCRVGC